MAKHFTAQVDRESLPVPFPIRHFYPRDLFSTEQGALRNGASQQLCGHLFCAGGPRVEIKCSEDGWSAALDISLKLITFVIFNSDKQTHLWV